jgi:DHA1 family tetracycline resistance protein-like MFS transporter
MTIVAALMTVFFIMQLVGQVPAALWVIFGEDRFRWSATMIGLSLAVFGILHALAQAFVTGPATKRFGEKQAIIAGMAADALGYVLLAFATRGWMAFPIMILLASGGIGMPALQAMLSRQVDDDQFGNPSADHLKPLRSNQLMIKAPSNLRLWKYRSACTFNTHAINSSRLLPILYSL